MQVGPAGNPGTVRTPPIILFSLAMLTHTKLCYVNRDKHTLLEYVSLYSQLFFMLTTTTTITITTATTDPHSSWPQDEHHYSGPMGAIHGLTRKH